jgi:hypothetical protein
MNHDLPTLAARLDAMTHKERVAESWKWGGRAQRRLFDALEGFRPVTLNDFAAPVRTAVTHAGRNSQLPGFREFAKVFWRPSADATELWGYNVFWLSPLIGPGFFVLRQHSPTETVVDYTQLPPEAPEGWPRIVPNWHRFGWVVYHGTQDVMRGLSKHVTIGRAVIRGRMSRHTFVLVRRDEP